MTEPNRVRPGNGCPPWCTADHRTTGNVHRVEVGAARVAGKYVPVVILQTPGGAPSVVISGPVFVEVHPDDQEDMARLLDLADQGELAGLIRQAADVTGGGVR
ncbi:hypothetical protein [Thermomonospora cellulosilytica]|uniref:Uncharacterized protein n=1 Tax=Thermomonospora cellulosilytica TaxID=1411118 RepID=A0A7W3MUF2_9ACTN|nr:hypothetical protein [Thermomonospora cellulosilytica]MBA9002059.1 hypothetical protein [Thermomonospora cellulosilytica]